ncbi:MULTISPECIES: hypothetical protein [Rhodomicrobium]|uniref:hypothetical protein n=1 Tax=Rhodomicrobium TaxID=1068 RepID=UPI000F73A49D|nr:MULTISPECIES: hypothetical protein [Rhodomicrobium]
MRKLVLTFAALSSAALLSACYETPPETSLVPQDYSPNYTHLRVASEDGRTKKVLVPEACLAVEKQSPADDGPPRLPPGCANNYNLQRMVERKRDLTKGRPLSPAAAAPVSRAAQNYIDGKKEPALGGDVRSTDGATQAPTTTSETPVQQR